MATSYVNTALRPQIMQSVHVKSERQLKRVCVCVCVFVGVVFREREGSRERVK